MPEESFEHQEIVRLLAKLKDETPDYPEELLEERKYSFMKQIVDLKISGGGPTGGNTAKSSTGMSGSGAAGGAGTTIFGLSLKTALAIGAVIVLLTAAYLFRDQVVEYLAENQIISTQEAAPPIGSTRVGPAQETQTAVTTPTLGAPSSGNTGTQGAPGLENGGPTKTPAPPEQEGPFSIIQYLICILRSDTQSCK